MAQSKFRKGQRVICTHYKKKPVVTISEVYKGERWANTEIWVLERVNKKDGTFYTKSWWGPPSWFKAIRPIKKPKAPKSFAVTGLATEGSLCDAGIPGCSCNQSASVAQ